MFDMVVNETYIHNQDKISPELSNLCASDLNMLMAGLRNPLADMRNPWALSSKLLKGCNPHSTKPLCLQDNLRAIDYSCIVAKVAMLVQREDNS